MFMDNKSLVLMAAKACDEKKAKDIISEDKKIDEVSKEYDEYKSKNSVD